MRNTFLIYLLNLELFLRDSGIYFVSLCLSGETLKGRKEHEKKKETKEENKIVNILKSAGKTAAVMTVGLLLSGVLPTAAAPKISKLDVPAAAPKIKELERLSEDEIFELMGEMADAADLGLLSPVALQINEAILNEELILRNKNVTDANSK